MLKITNPAKVLISALAIACPSSVLAVDLALHCEFTYSLDTTLGASRDLENGRDVALRLNLDASQLDIEEITGVAFEKQAHTILFHLVSKTLHSTGRFTSIWRYTLNGTNGAMKEEWYAFLSEDSERRPRSGRQDAEGRDHLVTTYYDCRKVDALF